MGEAAGAGHGKVCQQSSALGTTLRAHMLDGNAAQDASSGVRTATPARVPDQCRMPGHHISNSISQSHPTQYMNSSDMLTTATNEFNPKGRTTS